MFIIYSFNEMFLTRAPTRNLFKRCVFGLRNTGKTRAAGIFIPASRLARSSTPFRQHIYEEDVIFG
jgi:hypothetical protein